MPKRILFESAVHQLASSGKRRFTQLAKEGKTSENSEQVKNLRQFVHSWQFKHLDKGTLKIEWSYPKSGEVELNYKDVHFYTRGDSPKAVEEQKEKGLISAADLVREDNEKFFDSKFQEIATMAGVNI